MTTSGILTEVGCEDGVVMASGLHALYAATLNGRLDRFLARNPAFLTVRTARALADDFAGAVEFGDAVMASLAASAGSIIFQQLQMPVEALELHLEHLALQIETTTSTTDLTVIHEQALVAAAQADELEVPALVHGAWLLAAESVHLAGRAVTGTQRQICLQQALQELADLCERLAEQPESTRPRDILVRLAGNVAAVGGDAVDIQWDLGRRLSGQSALRRLARVAERVLSQDVLAEDTSRRGEVVRQQLLRVLLSGGRDSERVPRAEPWATGARVASVAGQGAAAAPVPQTHPSTALTVPMTLPTPDVWTPTHLHLGTSPADQPAADQPAADQPAADQPAALPQTSSPVVRTIVATVRKAVTSPSAVTPAQVVSEPAMPSPPRAVPPQPLVDTGAGGDVEPR